MSEGALAKDDMEDDILTEMKQEDWIDMSVINGKEAEMTRGGRTNGILFDHDDDKTLGSLNTRGVEELDIGEVSEDFARRNPGIRGIRDRATAREGEHSDNDINLEVPRPENLGEEEG